MSESGKVFAVNVFAPGYQLVLRVPGTDEVSVRDHFAELLEKQGLYRGEKDVVRFGPGMYVNVIGPWADYEEQRRQRREQEQEQQRVLAALAAGGGGGGVAVPRGILMPGRR